MENQARKIETKAFIHLFREELTSLALLGALHLHVLVLVLVLPLLLLLLLLLLLRALVLLRTLAFLCPCHQTTPVTRPAAMLRTSPAQVNRLAPLLITAKMRCLIQQPLVLTLLLAPLILAVDPAPLAMPTCYAHIAIISAMLG
jgi:hypothetical protein